MRKLVATAQFRKDYKRVRKRGYDLSLLEQVIDKLLQEETLEAKYRDHSLAGSMASYRECHIQPDWLLIYRIEDDRMILVAHRTGTHSDLFDE